MCSFLLLFLILIIGFDFLQDSIVELYPETAIAPSTCFGQTHVALALQAGESSQPAGSTAPLLDTCWASFQRPIIFEEDQHRDQEAVQNHGDGIIPMAMHSLPAYQQESGGKMCDLWSPLVNRYSPQYRTQSAQGDGVQRCLAATDVAVRLGRRLERLAMPFKSFAEPVQKSTSPSDLTEPEGAQKQRQGSGQAQAQRCRLECAKHRGTEHLQYLAFHALDSNNATMAFSGRDDAEPDAGSSYTDQFQQSGAISPETGMCCGAPSCLSGHQLCSTGDPRTHQKKDKDIDRLEKDNSKFVTKNLHAATTMLGKAQKMLTEALESKKIHRTRWIKHITEAVTTWQAQLQDYQKQQATFHAAATKARADIETARKEIQALSVKASQATLAAMPPIAAVSAEQEEGNTDADTEEEKLQSQLQSVLQTCAEALNVEAPQQVSEPEDMTMEDGEREKKRLRSMQPFGVPGFSGAPSDAKQT